MDPHDKSHQQDSQTSRFLRKSVQEVNGTVYTEFLNIENRGANWANGMHMYKMEHVEPAHMPIIEGDQIVPVNAEKISLLDVRSGDSIFIKRNKGATSNVESLEFTVSDDPVVNNIVTLLDGSTLNLKDCGTGAGVEIYRLTSEMIMDPTHDMITEGDLEEINDLVNLLTDSDPYEAIVKGDLVATSWITDDVSYTTEGVAYRKTPSGWETEQGYLLALEGSEFEYKILDERELLSNQVWEKATVSNIIAGNFVAVRSFLMDVVLTRMSIVGAVTPEGISSIGSDQMVFASDTTSECYVFRADE